MAAAAIEPATVTESATSSAIESATSSATASTTIVAVVMGSEASPRTVDKDMQAVVDTMKASGLQVEVLADEALRAVDVAKRLNKFARREAVFLCGGTEDSTVADPDDGTRDPFNNMAAVTARIFRERNKLEPTRMAQLWRESENWVVSSRCARPPPGTIAWFGLEVRFDCFQKWSHFFHVIAWPTRDGDCGRWTVFDDGLRVDGPRYFHVTAAWFDDLEKLCTDGESGDGDDGDRAESASGLGEEAEAVATGAEEASKRARVVVPYASASQTLCEDTLLVQEDVEKDTAPPLSSNSALFRKLFEPEAVKSWHDSVLETEFSVARCAWRCQPFFNAAKSLPAVVDCTHDD